ncbi:anti-sigma factor domain-containing protein [Paenibacillus aurantiacus]|uniref:Anti-sigma factor domain-containing protein n=1 Tax=Paenibacillus aurantiacus TaxID=1936118 RepID=A0ABV5KK30_9BACL
MNRAVVMEIRNNVAVVMTPDGEFRKVKAGEGVQVGDEVRLDEAAQLPRKRAWGARSRYGMGAAAAAIMLLLLTPWLAKVAMPEPAVAAYLTMDINPSVELGIDAKERVVELHPLNPDGARLIEGLEFKGKTAEAVAAAITSRARDAHYFDSNEGDIFITSVLMKGNEDYEDALTEHVNTAVKESLAAKKESGPATDAVAVSTLSVPEEVREEAKQSGVSSGKMAFYLLAKSEGHEVDLEELKHKSIHNTAKALGGVEKVLGSAEKKQEGETTIDKKSIKTKLKALAAENQSKRGQGKANAIAPTKPASAKPEKDDATAGSAAGGKTPAEPAKNGGKPAAASQGAGGKKQQDRAGAGQESGKSGDKNNRWKDREDDRQSDGWNRNDERVDDQNRDRGNGRRADKDDDRNKNERNTDRQDGQQGGKIASTGRHDGGSAGTQKDAAKNGTQASGGGSSGKNSGKTTETTSGGKSSAQEKEKNGKSQRDDDDQGDSRSNGKSREDHDDSDSGKNQGRGQTKQQERENGTSKSERERGSDKSKNKD